MSTEQESYAVESVPAEKPAGHALTKSQNSPALTPAHMLQMAVDRGAELDKLEKLMELQERWEANEARKAFAMAMNRFKANPPTITKNRTVDYTSKGQRTTYNHASLDHICDVIGSALGKVGISFVWRTAQNEHGVVAVTCILTHEAGHSQETRLQAAPDGSGGKNSIQAVGSTVSYLQRYTLLSATGMATAEQDDDGAASGADQSQAANAVGRITSNQAKTLRQLATTIGMTEAQLCKKSQANPLESLEAERFGLVLNALKKIQEKAKEKANASH